MKPELNQLAELNGFIKARVAEGRTVTYAEVRDFLGISPKQHIGLVFHALNKAADLNWLMSGDLELHRSVVSSKGTPGAGYEKWRARYA
jgi:alkylated DNA nucleotide flippase Atl1